MRLGERVEPARRGHEHARAAGLAHGIDVTRRHVDGVRLVEQIPGQVVGAARAEPRPEHGDGALAVRVQVHERAALRLRVEATLHAHPVLAQLGVGAVSGLVVAEGGEQRGLPGELAQLHGGHRAAARRLLEGLGRMDDLSRPRHVRHLGELAPLDVAHHRNAHRAGACHDRALACRCDGRSAPHRAPRRGPALGDRAAHEPLVGTGRAARERDRLARGGGVRRLLLAGAERRAAAADRGPPRDRSCAPSRRTRAARRATATLALERLRGRLESALTVQRPRRADEADERVAAQARGVEATPRRAEAAAATAGALGDRRLGAAALALGRRRRGFRGRLADAAALALRRGRARAWRCCRRCRPPAGWWAPPAWPCSPCPSGSWWCAAGRTESKVVVPPTPRSEGVLFGSGSLPPALTIRTISRRKTIPPAPAATSLRRR